MLNRSDFYEIDPTVHQLTAQLGQDTAGLQKSLDRELETILRESADQLTALDRERQTAAASVERAQQALDAALEQQRQAAAAFEAAKAAPIRQERRLRQELEDTLIARQHQYDVELDELWHAYRRARKGNGATP